MKRVMRLNGGDKVTPDHATLFSKIAVLLVTIVEKLDDFRYSLLVKIVLGDRGRVVVVEHAMIEEYVGPVEGCEARDYFNIGCP